MNPYVVNVRTAKPGTFTYVGRRCGRFTGSKFGNPFKEKMPRQDVQMLLAEVGHRAAFALELPEVLNREAAVLCYRHWLFAQPELMEAARRELKGKMLGCWCAPLHCHSEILAEVAND